jgi:molybdenum cofactor cytidylyltransferase
MAHKKLTAGIILAAGMSKRFGRTKQLLNFGDKALLTWVVDACLNSQLDRIWLIIGYNHGKILDALSGELSHPRLKIVINSDYSKGQSTSLHAGIGAVQGNYPSVMFILGDQPMIDSETIDHLLECYWASEKNICVPFYKKQRGNPTIFGSMFYDDICRIEGDTGARKIIENNSEQVLKIALPEASFFHDIDTEKDLEKALQYLNDYRRAVPV